MPHSVPVLGDIVGLPSSSQQRLFHYRVKYLSEDFRPRSLHCTFDYILRPGTVAADQSDMP